MSRVRRPFLTAVAIALGVWLLTDVLRVWLPSVITIFGQAASTPAELLGAFALLWFVGALAVVPLLRPLGPRGVALVAGLALTACRLGLVATGGGQAQLYVASAGLLAGLVWLAATAVVVADPVPGLVLGLALGTATHAAVGTFDLTWRGGIAAWAVVGVVGLAFVTCVLPATGAAAGAGRHGSGAWFVLGPSLLLWAMIGGSPALTSTAVSYALGEEPGIAGPGPGSVLPAALVLAVSVGLLAAGALLVRPHVLTVVAGAAALVAGTAVFAWSWGPWLALAIPLTAAGLGLLLGATAFRAEATAPEEPEDDSGPATVTARGFAAAGGMAVFAVAAVLYYASYDIGYPNEWVPLAVAVVVAVVAGRPPYPRMDVDRSWSLTAVPLAVFATLIAAVLMPRNAQTRDADGEEGTLRLVAYNIRMGYGLDGRFDLDGLAAAIAGERPDVVLLSEVDRAWLLNGGHDTLALLAERLDMPYRFAPAADAVWGDAVLTRLPVVYTAASRLSSPGGPTGAQALGVVVDAGGIEMAVVSTHLQPPSGGGPVEQAREVARFALGFAAGRPLVVGGDLNTQPGEAAFAEFTTAGLLDGLAAKRPVLTSPSDAPAEQIDHLLVSGEVAATEIVVPSTQASDHLPVAATLTVF